jgi:hypothetical protein
MIATKRNPEVVGLPGQGNGNKSEALRKYSHIRLIPSMPVISMSIDKLSAIYRFQHNTSKPATVLYITPEEMMAVPDSSDMTFGTWFDLCKQIIDIYEEA